ncbi:MAG: hypothetical protein ACRD1X_08745 [Vicinamibacteria bacterium]
MNAVRKFQDTTWKFDRAAGHVNRCRKAVSTWAERQSRGAIHGMKSSDPDLGAFLAAMDDLPLHLDSMLLYLRIEADAFAALVPYFYEKAGGIPTRSFRDQQRWFVYKNPTFDPIYAGILSRSCRWFTELAGKNSVGLRDAIVHRGGTYQLGWTTPTDAKSFELLASVVNSKGFIEQDLLSALVVITEGWFKFLDQCCLHFRTIVQPFVTWVDFSRDDLSLYLHCHDAEPPSFWVYPRAT